MTVQKTNGVHDGLPAHDIAAERSVLGSVLRDNRSLDDVIGRVSGEHFYADAHRQIFGLMEELAAKRKPIDLVILADALKARGLLENIGGYGYLPTLLDAAPTGANLPHYVEIVRDKFFFRELERIGADMLREGKCPTGTAEEAAAQYEQMVFRLCETGNGSEPQEISETMYEALDRIDSRTRPGAVLGVPTGLEDLDRITGGLQDGELTVIGARTSVGKSSLGIGIAVHVAVRLGQPVYFASLEQSKLELSERLLVWESNVSSHLVRTGNLSPADQQSLIEASHRLKAKLFIDDNPYQKASHIAANARRLCRKHSLRLVIVDYLQLVEPDFRREDRHLQIGAITRRLKMMAAELSCPVIAMAQLNRDADDRARPKLRDLRESGSIEQDTDVAILLHRPDDEKRTHIEAIVAKNRNGQTGDCSLHFIPHCMKFVNAEQATPFDGNHY